MTEILVILYLIVGFGVGVSGYRCMGEWTVYGYSKSLFAIPIVLWWVVMWPMMLGYAYHGLMVRLALKRPAR